MKSLAELLAADCRHLTGAPLGAAQISAQLAHAGLDGWVCDGAAIERSYEFPDFRATMAFVNAVAEMADAQDHHPELTVTYARCRVRFDTHSVGGVSINDFICGARTDALYAARQHSLR